MIPPVVDLEWLRAHPPAVIADVRHYLDGRSGTDAYAAGHIPGAIRVELDTALAAPATAADGRHPLPEPQAFADAMATLGIGDDTTVVAYDDLGGAMAARLVWMLRMLGHDAALLDGGLAAWPAELSAEAPVVARATFTARPWPTEALATIDDAAAGEFVIDARAPERFRGESEPLDVRAGHIPGARNYPLTGNLDAAGRFLSPEALRERFAAVDDAANVISSCGSGVTACHNLVALEYAGLGRGRLYPGSWSQWSATDRPAATGE